VPGCRSSRGLECHHRVHRADGGSHDTSNLVLLCSSCHLAHHRGTLTISGTADQLEVHRPAQVSRSFDSVESSGGSLPAPSAAVRGKGRVQTCDAQQLSASRDASPPTASSDASTGVHVGAPSESSMNVEHDRSKPASKLDVAILRTQACAALAGLGWKSAIAHAAVDAAIGAEGPDVTLQRLIFESLRRCPVSRA
jgi:hypothetical protein